jgi:hypothetical protein
MKSTLRTLGRSSTHRQPEMHVYRVLDFEVPVYKGFSVPVFGHFPGDGFPAIARETPVLLAFLQFGCPFGTPIFHSFLASKFSKGLFSGVSLSSGVELALASVCKFQAQLEPAKMNSPVIHHRNERPKIEAFGGSSASREDHE